MQCPKCKEINLQPRSLLEHLQAQHCDQCEGHWLEGEVYRVWKIQNGEPIPQQMTLALDHEFQPPSTDSKAALCPECRRYLSRVKIPVNAPFYLEKCPQCNGFWCDRGEWEILTTLSLIPHLDYLFTSEWQSKVREQQHSVSERQALIQKLGKDLAEQIFNLAKDLEHNPNGDFAVAYLMRQVSEHQKELQGKKASESR